MNVSGRSHSTCVEWLKSLGTTFVDVLICAKGKEPFYEEHVADMTTLPDTVRMSLERARGSVAVYPWMNGWVLHRLGQPVRNYATKEAAEMVAIHRA